MKAKSNLYLKQEDAFISVDYDDTPDLKFASYNKFIIDNKKVPFHGNLIINNISYINPRVLNRNPETLACLHDYFHRNNILGNMNAVNCAYIINLLIYILRISFIINLEYYLELIKTIFIQIFNLSNYRMISKRNI